MTRKTPSRPLCDGLDLIALEHAVRERDLIGVNIHYDPTTGDWSCWTRRRDFDGWNRSGQHETAALAVAASLRLGDGETEQPPWEGLV